MTQPIPDSRRPRPAVYDSAREIHFFVLRSLAGIRDRCATLARRSAERAALAVELATAGHSPVRNLTRALTAIRTSMFHCDTLCAVEMIDRQAHDYVRRRVDQLIAGLEALKTTPPDRWLDVPLAPIEPSEPGEAVPLTRFETVLERVAQVVDSILPRASSSLEMDPSIQRPQRNSR